MRIGNSVVKKHNNFFISLHPLVKTKHVEGPEPADLSLAAHNTGKTPYSIGTGTGCTLLRSYLPSQHLRCYNYNACYTSLQNGLIRVQPRRKCLFW